MPRLLIVPPALEAAGLEILNAERDAAGATNVWRGTAELLVVPWLA
jgi:phage major head subunit gpT-like protein